MEGAINTNYAAWPRHSAQSVGRRKDPLTECLRSVASPLMTGIIISNRVLEHSLIDGTRLYVTWIAPLLGDVGMYY